MKTLLAISAVILSLLGGPARGEEIRVAAASNFRATLAELAQAFERGSRHQLVLIFGSSGKHYAQIVNGAPFDVFLSADLERPERLEREGIAVENSRFTYATGRLALWSTSPDLVDEGGAVLGGDSYRHLAIAHPELAPYGRAAMDTLQAVDALENARPRLVRGESVGQTFQFVSSGNAELGFIAWPQLISTGRIADGSHWLVPESLHRPIVQQAVLLTESPAAVEFYTWLRDDDACAIIRAHGYGMP